MNHDSKCMCPVCASRNREEQYVVAVRELDIWAEAKASMLSIRGSLTDIRDHSTTFDVDEIPYIAKEGLTALDGLVDRIIALIESKSADASDWSLDANVPICPTDEVVEALRLLK